ncbi:MAG TPA: MFS transporter [Anaerolineae bacterium]|nr:MFS transporter [Anaerolineae bacterium]
MPTSRLRSPRFILFTLAFGVFVAADDLTVVSTMLRQMIFDLDIPLPEGLDDAAWIVNAYLIAYVVVMPFIGRLSDLIGRRAVYIGSLTLFLIGSIWVPFATSLPSFIFGRVVSALGGGAMVPVSMAIIADIYPAERRATALGTLGAIDTAGWVWGPLYGALLIRYLTWQWQFYLNIPLSLIGIIAAWYALTDLPTPQNNDRVDWLGALALTISLLTLNIALLNTSGNIQGVTTLDQLRGDTATNTQPLYLTALITGLIFIGLQLFLGRHPSPPSSTNPLRRWLQVPPLIDLTLFRTLNFTLAIIINFLVGAILIIAMVNVPLVINILEFDVADAALTSGWLLSAMTASMALTAYLGGQLTERWSYRPVTLLGLVACLLGFTLMGTNWQLNTPYTTMAGQLAILGAGFGLVTAPIGTAVVNAAPDHHRGVAASLVIVLRLIGMSVGLSALTAWGLYRFNTLRRTITVAVSRTDPTYPQAIANALADLTVGILTETFIICALLALLAFLISLGLRRDQ